MSVKRSIFTFARGVSLLLWSAGAWGITTSSTTFQVSASIVAGCVISGTNVGVLGTLNFGTQSGVATNSVRASFVKSSSINLACTPGTTLSMTVNGGANYTSSRNLKLASSGNTVPYYLYTNAAHTNAIPVGEPVALTYSNANNITLPIYGLLQLPGPTSAGVYTDTLTVTLSW